MAKQGKWLLGGCGKAGQYRAGRKNVKVEPGTAGGGCPNVVPGTQETPANYLQIA